MYCVQVLHSEGFIILGRLGFCHFLFEIFKRINYSLALGFKFSGFVYICPEKLPRGLAN